MSAAFNGGEPAFARGIPGNGDVGLTKRELLAAMAMQGLLACGDAVLEAARLKPDAPLDAIATMSVTMADVLLQRLEQFP